MTTTRPAAQYKVNDDFVQYDGKRVTITGRWFSRTCDEWKYEAKDYGASSSSERYVVHESELSAWSEFDDAATIGNVARFLARGEHDKAEMTLRELPPEVLANASQVGTMLDNLASKILRETKV